MSEDSMILAHLKRSSITPAVAYARYRCLVLHSAISRLRGLGHRIDCKMESRGTKRWGRYTLIRGKGTRWQ